MALPTKMSSTVKGVSDSINRLQLNSRQFIYTCIYIYETLLKYVMKSKIRIENKEFD